MSNIYYELKIGSGLQAVDGKLEQSGNQMDGWRTMAGVRKDGYKKIFTELEAIAKVQSIKSSNAIEGIVTSDERIAAIVNQNSAPLNHNEAEIAGYRDALNEIHIGFEHDGLYYFGFAYMPKDISPFI